MGMRLRLRLCDVVRREEEEESQPNDGGRGAVSCSGSCSNEERKSDFASGGIS